jgi:FKBP-type peptidyl-prolyl cis-trans isomerase
MDAFLLGLHDAFNESEPRMSLAEMNASIQTFMAELNYRQELEIQKARMERYGSADLQQTTTQYKFLASHMKKSGVVTVQSGLQYELIRPGYGERPKRSDWVKVHFKGTLIDGTEYDSSYSKGEPSIFPVSQLVSGWSEAIQMMQVGGRWRLVIPPNLAYGEHGDGDKIPPNAVLIIDMELIGIVEPKKIAEN